MKDLESKKKKRTFGEHLTPIKIFKDFILPEIKDKLFNYIWVDLFAGEGNLILPILNLIPEKERAEFFKDHIFLFDIQEELVRKGISNAMEYGIPKEIAEKNISQRDTIKDFPSFLLNKGKQIVHITNPPYLYIGYIKKHLETQKYLDYFKGPNEGLQDLFQLALMSDLRFNVNRMIYIIPSNFLFGLSSANKIRSVFFKYYNISKAIIFEKKIFEFTGTNVMICFFERKKIPKDEAFEFNGIKINKQVHERVYRLSPENHYRAGGEFETFANEFHSSKPIKVYYYLLYDEAKKNVGKNEIEVIDANDFNGNNYLKKLIYVNETLCEKIKSNILCIRTVDTGSMNGRAGLYVIKDVFGVEGVLVTKSMYRTHPIQLFFEPQLSFEEQLLLRDYFNTILEYFRVITDSEFMTTYKYSNSQYIRKYLGLSQAKALISTFPLLDLNYNEREVLIDLIKKRDGGEIMKFLKQIKKGEKTLC